MVENVACVGRAQLKAPEVQDKFGVIAMEAQVKDRLFASLFAEDLDLFLTRSNDLLDASWVNASVGHKLAYGDAGDFATHRIEARNRNRL